MTVLQATYLLAYLPIYLPTYLPTTTTTTANTITYYYYYYYYYYFHYYYVKTHLLFPYFAVLDRVHACTHVARSYTTSVLIEITSPHLRYRREMRRRTQGPPLAVFSANPTTKKTTIIRKLVEVPVSA
jgi:hypothetical protein